ncbi:Ogr/Delta-like zinc finger protein [Enterobacter sp. BIGb0383]|uniref:ogr/Delta-like zinc finger family protein n=1 Tax=unclassified Enterobacter TaxID=2608935 RepID=UPI000F472125|nr:MULTISPECIES: ogr/Delta-like zinc finger family protein [unclassified Enterobacter]ROP49858.1 Ogr/Delta-like zinc finger protein [Enterobacter sp. BIGb0383]ROS06400.1 Ogr/Delta-like zinc finger protein [Enterobacter sp. BIGb0359]
MMRCPYCKKAAHVRTSRYLSDNVKQSYLQCVNVFCSATFRTLESIDEIIRPPAQTEAPAPAAVPVLPPVLQDRARVSQRH